MTVEEMKKFCRKADIIIPQGGDNAVAIKLLTDYIKSLL